MPLFPVSTPIGDLTLVERDGAIVAVNWGRSAGAEPSPTPVLAEAAQQLERYFAGDLAPFDLPLAPAGKAFQQQVGALMCEIRAGYTMTYGEMATRLGSDARAVGGACGANPIPVLIPCHRVVGAGGKLIGYSGRGGIETKVRLLQLEGVLL